MHTDHVAHALTRAELYLESKLQVPVSRSSAISKVEEEQKKLSRKYLGTIQIAAAGALALALSSCGPLGVVNGRSANTHSSESFNSMNSINAFNSTNAANSGYAVPGSVIPHGVYFSYPSSTSYSAVTPREATAGGSSESESVSHGGFGGHGGAGEGHGGEGGGE